MRFKHLKYIAVILFYVIFSESKGQSNTSEKEYVCPPCNQRCDLTFFGKAGACPICRMELREKGSYNRQLSKREIKEDLGILIRTLKTNHPGIYDYRSEKEVDSLFENYSNYEDSTNKLGGNMDFLNFYEVVSKIVAAVGDAHTYPMNPIEARVLQEELLFPIKPEINNNQIFLNGKRLKSINGNPENEILKELQAVSNSDGNTLPYKNAFIEMEFPLRYFVSMDRASVFEVRYADGSIELLSGRSYFEQGLNTQSVEPSFTIENKRALLKIPTWEDDTSGSFNMDLEEMERNSILGMFIKESLRKVQTSEIERLVIDLRGNTGGKSGPAAILLRHLIDVPFQYYGEIYLSSSEFPTKKYITNTELIDFYGSEKATGLIDEKDGKYYFKDKLLPFIEPVENAYQGRVEILVDKYTLSVSTDVVAILSAHREVTVTGDEIGGSLQHYCAGNYLNLRLPHSKIEVNVPLQRLCYFPGLKKGKIITH